EQPMFKSVSYSARAFSPSRSAIALIVIVLLSLLLIACDSSSTQSTQTTGTATTSGGNSKPTFPTTPPPLRVPAFGSSGQVAPTVKVLASVDPTLIVQFPLFPASI